MTVYNFTVGMSCDGCVTAVKAALASLPGTACSVSLPDQRVTVDSSLPYDTIKDALVRTGKPVS
ncbi:2601_t:CDS:2 [Diversispora eburnea]|uniref:2601_t:CDS:1 n=1 Tax=Diversispora eburnea TaxID=1213867 RepID=A0A9N9A4A3_9GLOM|nr:2601_t:CDS:2 [Diversispora eburnea]